MRQTSRRTVLAGIATTALGGCLSDDSEGSAESPTDRPATSPTTTQPASGTRTDGTGATKQSPTPTPTSTATDASPTATATPTPDWTPDEDSSLHADYEKTMVCVRSTEGELLGCVYAAIADTHSLRYTGLSDTESLPENRGMLFVFSTPGDHTFVMREMDFGLDIVYADSDGVITKTHHAPAPGPGEDGNDQKYPGYGQYVLEVNEGWTTERDISEGDVLQFDLE
jgi:uncharacterized membrane protein (UPF0127 family)